MKIEIYAQYFFIDADGRFPLFVGIECGGLAFESLNIGKPDALVDLQQAVRRLP